MEFIGGILVALFLILSFICAFCLVGFGFRTGWLWADKFNKWPKE